MREPGPPEAIAQATAALGQMKIDQPQTPARRQHGVGVGQNSPPVRHHGQRVGKINPIHRPRRLPERGVGFNDFDVGHAEHALPRNRQQCRTQIDQLDAGQRSDRPGLFDCRQIAAGAAAEFHHARGGGNFQRFDQCVTPVQQPRAEGVVTFRLRRVEAFQTLGVAAGARQAAQHAQQNAGIRDEVSREHPQP